MHTVKKDLEIVHDGAIVGVDGEFEFDDGVGFVDFEVGFCDGIVDAVVDVEGVGVLVGDTVAPNVAFVGKDEGSCKRADGDAGAFVVVADCADDLTDFFRREV